MPAFEQVNDVPTPAFPVVSQDLDGYPWVCQTVEATEAEADAAAIALVDAGKFRARVCKPTGALFSDAE